jgi:hypothetical protein
VGVTGSTYYSPNGSFTISGSGWDIYGTADAFQYAAQPISGNCAISAQVQLQGSDTNPWAQTGVMIRNSLSASDMEASVAVTPTQGVWFLYRTAAGGTSSSVGVSGVTAPCWVQVVRSGNTFTGEYSTNGTTWTQIGSSQTIPMGTNTYIGLDTTSHNNSESNTSLVGNVTVSIPPSPWVAQDIGSVGVAGSTSYNYNANGTFTQSGSGTDIFGTADAFQFASQPVSGNCAISAQVQSQGTSTSGWAKTGVMIRNSLSPSDMEASVVVTPSHGISFQYRTASGGSSSYTAVTGMTAPCWVQLARSGNNFTASWSPNGVTWTTIGSPVTIPMGTNTDIGLATTAQNNSELNTSVIGNVTVTP